MPSFEELFVIGGEDLAKFKAALSAVNEQLKVTAREAKAASAGWSEAFYHMRNIAGRMK